MTILGSCHCGEVSYEVSSIDGSMMNCFCDTCRKTHSAEHNTAARVRSDNFNITRGRDSLKAYESTPGKNRWFCSKCGCHIYAERPHQPDVVIVRVATFDTDPGQVPEFSIWMSHARKWLAFDPNKTTFDEWNVS